jgi:phage tail protein X
MSGSKSPLTITRVNIDPAGKVEIVRNVSFTAMLNPQDLTHSRSISYDERPTLGQVGSPLRFRAVGPDTVGFSLLFDGTGVVKPVSAAAEVKQVIEYVAELNRVVFLYDGAKHEPGHVRVLWGTLILCGRLQSMSTQYTLFKPSGEPLRAKVALQFKGFISQKQESLMANRSSPDLSHVVEVHQGDTLPLLCHRIYGDASYYPEVARVNGLAQFRSLEPGRKLHFPPLE